MANSKHLLVGGLVAMRFDSTGKYLLAVTHSGRGIFFSGTWERVAREATLAYPTNGKAIGIGPIAGQGISVLERNDQQDQIRLDSPDGKYHLVGESEGITVTD